MSADKNILARLLKFVESLLISTKLTKIDI